MLASNGPPDEFSQTPIWDKFCGDEPTAPPGSPRLRGHITDTQQTAAWTQPIFPAQPSRLQRLTFSHEGFSTPAGRGIRGLTSCRCWGAALEPGTLPRPRAWGSPGPGAMGFRQDNIPTSELPLGVCGALRREQRLSSFRGRDHPRLPLTSAAGARVSVESFPEDNLQGGGRRGRLDAGRTASPLFSVPSNLPDSCPPHTPAILGPDILLPLPGPGSAVPSAGMLSHPWRAGSPVSPRSQLKHHLCRDTLSVGIRLGQPRHSLAALIPRPSPFQPPLCLL